MAYVFPNYPITDLPAIPANWKSTTWRNDACPSYTHNGLRIWVDYVDVNMRECPTPERFAVVPHTEDGDNAGLSLLETNDWDEVLRFVENHKR